jgi:drug/metabolite transporter (DMT)-like permease
VTKAAYVSVAAPIVAVTLGAIVRHEQLAATSLLGSVVVLAGVALGLQPWRRPVVAATGKLD